MKIQRKEIKKAIQILTSGGPVALLKAFKQHVIEQSTPYRPDESKIAFKALKANTFKGMMIDVGAHFGSALSQFVESGWQVVAFEPDSGNREKLVKSFGNRLNVVIDPRAVSDVAQEQMTLYRSEESTGISGLSSFHSSHQPVEKVDVTTIGDFFDEQGMENYAVDFLKIDTEGFDLCVLKGVPWGKVTPRLILCEFEDSKTVRLGYTFHDLAEFLVGHRYRLVVSEWYPIKKYGGPHDWRRFMTYPCELEDQRAWGNILAAKEDDIYESILNLCKLSC